MVLDKGKIAKNFSKQAEQYDQHAFIQHEIGQRLFERLDYMSISPKTILDLGSGTGAFSQKLIARYPDAHLIALDHASNMLQVHQSREKEKVAISYVQADMETLPLANDSIDLIFANLSLHWTAALSTVLAECQRVLRKEGLLLFSTLGPDSFYQLRESFAMVDDLPHIHAFYDLHQIGNALVQARFDQPVVDRDAIEVTYPVVKRILQDLKGVGAQNCHVDRARGLMGKTRFQAMQNAYEQFKTSDGRYPVHYEVIYGQAFAVAQMQENQSETRVFIADIPRIRRDR